MHAAELRTHAGKTISEYMPYIKAGHRGVRKLPPKTNSNGMHMRKASAAGRLALSDELLSYTFPGGAVARTPWGQ